MLSQHLHASLGTSRDDADALFPSAQVTTSSRIYCAACGSTSLHYHQLPDYCNQDCDYQLQYSPSFVFAHTAYSCQLP